MPASNRIFFLAMVLIAVLGIAGPAVEAAPKNVEVFVGGKKYPSFDDYKAERIKEMQKEAAAEKAKEDDKEALPPWALEEEAPSPSTEELQKTLKEFIKSLSAVTSSAKDSPASSSSPQADAATIKALLDELTTDEQKKQEILDLLFEKEKSPSSPSSPSPAQTP